MEGDFLVLGLDEVNNDVGTESVLKTPIAKPLIAVLEGAFHNVFLVMAPTVTRGRSYMV